MPKRIANRSKSKTCTSCMNTNRRKNAITTKTSRYVHSAKKENPTENNRKAQWQTYQNLQKQINQAWTVLQTAVKQKARPDTILAHRNHLLLLLGECNYLAHEYMRLTTVSKRPAA